MPSRSSFSSWGAILLLLALCGCSATLPVAGRGEPAGKGERVIALFPVENLSGGSAPLPELRRELAGRLKERGWALLPEDRLEGFMARHRLRYVGGIDATTAKSLRAEEGVAAVLITELELYQPHYPPRIALTSRLVTTEEPPRILRMASVAFSGDDAQGLLGIGLVKEPQRLRERALKRLAEALSGGKPQQVPSVRLSSESLYRAQPLDPQRSYRVAVIPFFNKGSRRYAGEILALHFMRELVRLGRFQVIEPGLVREDLLRYRIIMEEGVSLADAELLFGMLSADLLFSGEVNDYEDQQGVLGTPKVDFSALLLERQSRRSVWAVGTHQTGMDRVHLFDIGRISTASALAAGMARTAVEELSR